MAKNIAVQYILSDESILPTTRIIALCLQRDGPSRHKTFIAAQLRQGGRLQRPLG
jgi:hypothetical protein